MTLNFFADSYSHCLAYKTIMFHSITVFIRFCSYFISRIVCLSRSQCFLHLFVDLYMLFPPLYAAINMADAPISMAADSMMEADDEDFTVVSTDEIKVKEEPMTKGSSSVQDDDAHMKTVAPLASNFSTASGSGHCAEAFNMDAGESVMSKEDASEEDGWELPDDVWTRVREICHHPAAKCRRVKMGSIAMQLYEPEEPGPEVPRKVSGKATSIKNFQSHIEVLFACVAHLNDRCTELEKKEAASSSSTRDIPTSRRKTAGGSSAEFYDLPVLRAWAIGDGHCQWCNHKWSAQYSTQNFSTDSSTWECIMNKMYLDWTAEKMISGEKCKLKDSYIHAASSAATSLHSCDIVPADAMIAVEAQIRNRLYQPDVFGDTKPLWFYMGGKTDKYLCFGCIHCQRGTTLYYNDPRFREQLNWFFQA